MKPYSIRLACGLRLGEGSVRLPRHWGSVTKVICASTIFRKKLRSLSGRICTIDWPVAREKRWSPSRVIVKTNPGRVDICRRSHRMASDLLRVPYDLSEGEEQAQGSPSGRSFALSTLVVPGLAPAKLMSTTPSGCHQISPDFACEALPCASMFDQLMPIYPRDFPGEAVVCRIGAPRH
jgi:hypothetical protein